MFVHKSNPNYLAKCLSEMHVFTKCLSEMHVFTKCRKVNMILT